MIYIEKELAEEMLIARVLGSEVPIRLGLPEGEYVEPLYQGSWQLAEPVEDILKRDALVLGRYCKEKSVDIIAISVDTDEVPSHSLLYFFNDGENGMPMGGYLISALEEAFK